MTVAKYGHNHVINPETGFLENPAYSYDFDSEKKIQFLEAFRSNGLALYKTCKQLKIGHQTINKHYQLDPAFKKAMDQVRDEYADELESVSRTNALNPKSVIERIFQLKSIFPGKYSDQKGQQLPQITINIDGKLIEEARRRTQFIDAETVEKEEKLPDAQKSEMLDNQSKRVLGMGEIKHKSGENSESLDSQQV